MQSGRFIIYCDESDSKGKYFPNFYGGALVEASKQKAVDAELQAKKDALNVFRGEMKWERVTPHYASKYIEFLELVFDIIARGDLKVRVMFTHNQHRPNLQDYQIGKDYLLLYYQFLKHAFGLQYSTHGLETASAAVLLDDMPADTESINEFRRYLANLSDYPKWRKAGFSLAFDDITTVNSRDHNIMQALDIILGGVNSRLNEKHTRVIPPARRRSKRARAKEQVYAVIKRRVKELYPNFNFGVSTSVKGDLANRFHHPYRHWEFQPSDSTHDPSRTKRAERERRKGPAGT